MGSSTGEQVTGRVRNTGDVVAWESDPAVNIISLDGGFLWGEKVLCAMVAGTSWVEGVHRGEWVIFHGKGPLAPLPCWTSELGLQRKGQKEKRPEQP